MLDKLFSDHQGNPSSMRLFVAFIIIAQIGVWGAYCLRNNVFEPMDWQSMLTILGSLYFKQAQKTTELSKE